MKTGEENPESVSEFSISIGLTTSNQRKCGPPAKITVNSAPRSEYSYYGQVRKTIQEVRMVSVCLRTSSLRVTKEERCHRSGRVQYRNRRVCDAVERGGSRVVSSFTVVCDSVTREMVMDQDVGVPMPVRDAEVRLTIITRCLSRVSASRFF
jgi:hypothetical protein